MAVISSTQDALVVRIVYDGPPMAGKTSSLRTLAAKLGGSLRTPSEIDGRTLYFDWLDYTGGLFEGRRIRCQIVSVPGQASLASRRRALLETADAVVFVTDTTRDAIAQGRSYLRATHAVLGSKEGPGVGIVLQANKRDHVDALPLPALRAALDASDEKLAIVESVATDGSGIREAFVFAVRLALDRVRELMRSSLLETTEPLIDSAEQLLDELGRREGGRLELAAVGGLRHTRLPTNSEAPRLPRADLPGGMIWPPVQGRVTLHEATAAGPSLHRQADGEWRSVDSPDWLIQSPARGQFHDLSAARSAMLEWARAHSAHAGMLGGRRCIALANDGAGSYRLWQFVSVSTQRPDGSRFDGLMPYPFLPGQDLLTSARSSKTRCESLRDDRSQRSQESTMPETPRDEVTPDDSAEQNQEADAYDPVDEAGWESFPASDPPAWSVASKRK